LQTLLQNLCFAQRFWSAAAMPIAKNAELLTYDGFDYPADEPLATSNITGDSGGVRMARQLDHSHGDFRFRLVIGSLPIRDVKPTYHGLEPSGNALVMTKDMNNRRKFDTKPAGVYGNQECCGTDAYIGGEGAARVRCTGEHFDFRHELDKGRTRVFRLSSAAIPSGFSNSTMEAVFTSRVFPTKYWTDIPETAGGHRRADNSSCLEI